MFESIDSRSESTFGFSLVPQVLSASSFEHAGVICCASPHEFDGKIRARCSSDGSS